jgi:hypothetical protein
MAAPLSFVDFLAALHVGKNDLDDLGWTSSLGVETVTGFAEELSREGLVALEGRSLTLRPGDRVLVGCYLLQRGVSVEKLSRVLDWREFEDLVSKFLAAQSFTTWRNFRMRKPTREIDVIGLFSGFAIAFDCKHWQRAGLSSLSLAAEKQTQRVRQLVMSSAIPEVEVALPALVVLGPLQRSSIGGVPVVHPDGLVDFIMGASGHASEFCTFKRPRGGVSGIGATQARL